MDDISTSDTPEPLLVGPPLPQEPPTNKPSLQDVLFGFSSEHKFEHDDQESLASLDDPVPIPAMHPVEPPREISMGKQDLISISGDTFYEDRSLEARIHRSLKHTPTCDAIAKMNPKRQMPQQKAEISREAKLERTLEQMRNELKESQDRISDLQTENKILHEECQRLQLRLAQKDDTSGKILRQEVERLQRSVKNLTTQKNQYQAEAKSMTLAKSATEEERTRMVTTWQIAERDANDAQIECSKLRKELETSQNESVEAKRSKSMMEEQLMDLRKHNKLLDEKILAESITSRATVAEIQLKLDKKESGCKEMQTKVHELSMHLEAKSKACSALMTKKAQLEERLKRPLLHHQEVQTDVITWTNPETFTHSDRALSLKRPHPVSTAARPISSDSMLPPKISPTFDSTDGNSLSDRLIRIRESAEKASLIREHQRDMSRLQSEHAAQIASQQQEFNEESGRMAEESLAELNHRIKELKRRLVTEYEKKLDELERKHKKELQRMKDETDRQSATATESVEAAMSELARTTSLLERETRKRHALQVHIEKLESEYASEKQLLLHEFDQELQNLHAFWEEDKNALLTSVQAEYNSIIDRSRERPIRSTPKFTSSFPRFTTTTPKSSTPHFSNEVSLLAKSDVIAPQGSPTVSLSELSEALLETEAIVRQVLKNGAL